MFEIDWKDPSFSPISRDPLFIAISRFVLAKFLKEMSPAWFPSPNVSVDRCACLVSACNYQRRLVGEPLRL